MNIIDNNSNLTIIDNITEKEGLYLPSKSWNNLKLDFNFTAHNCEAVNVKP